MAQCAAIALLTSSSAGAVQRAAGIAKCAPALLPPAASWPPGSAACSRGTGRRKLVGRVSAAARYPTRVADPNSSPACRAPDQPLQQARRSGAQRRGCRLRHQQPAKPAQPAGWGSQEGGQRGPDSFSAFCTNNSASAGADTLTLALAWVEGTRPRPMAAEPPPCSARDSVCIAQAKPCNVGQGIVAVPGR
jgi:hypothetical protein